MLLSRIGDAPGDDSVLTREGARPVHAGEFAFDIRGNHVWERLFTGNRRVVDTLRVARPALGDVPEWSIDVSFSAPVFKPR